MARMEITSLPGPMSIQQLWQRHEALRQRVWELEQHLLDAVPRSLEKNDSDL